MKKINLTRKQYDKLIENKDAINIYLQCKHRWHLMGVVVYGEESDIEIIANAI